MAAPIRKIRESIDSGQKLYTVPETADILRVSRSTVYNLFENGKLAYHKIGGAIRIARSDIDALLAASRRGNEVRREK